MIFSAKYFTKITAINDCYILLSVEVLRLTNNIFCNNKNALISMKLISLTFHMHRCDFGVRQK